MHRLVVSVTCGMLLATCALGGAAPEYGSGKFSDFELSGEMGGGLAHITGVSNLTGADFKLTLYQGNTWDMDGKPPAVAHSNFCFTGSSALIDAEKDKTYNNADDYWCSEFTCLNLAYFGGWIPKKSYATVDALADAFRKSYAKRPDDLYIFNWLDGKLKSFGLSSRGSVMDYQVDFEGDLDSPDALDDLLAFLQEQFKDDLRWIYLNASGHAVTCCGYSVDAEGALNGLFIIDSDNDMFNKGGSKAPNRIMFCPVRVYEESDGEGEDAWYNLQIANIFAEEWTAVDRAYALRNVNEKLEPFEFVFDPNDETRIIGSKGYLPLDSTKLVIPEGVREIAEYAFCNNTRVTSVILPDSMEHIGEYAFARCYKLASVKLNEQLLSIGAWAFYCCESLKEIAVPDGVTSVGDSAFHGCTKLAKVTLGAGVESLSGSVFRYCKALKSIVLPPGLSSVGYDCFSECTALEKVVINGEVRFDTTAFSHYGPSAPSRLPKVKFASGEDGTEILGWSVLQFLQYDPIYYPAEEGKDPFALHCEEWGCQAWPTIGFGWSMAHVFFGEFKSAEGQVGTLKVTTGKKTVGKNGDVTVAFTVAVKVGSKTYSYTGGKIVNGEITTMPKCKTKGAPALEIDALDGEGALAHVGGNEVMGDLVVAPQFVGYEQESASAMVGFRYLGQASFNNELGGLKFSASGLPKGLAINATTGEISGVPTKSGTFNVKITATNKAWTDKKASATVEIVIAPMAEFTYGSFTGVLAGDSEYAVPDGFATMTIGKTGKISGKFVLDGTNWTFSATGYSADASVYTIPGASAVLGGFECAATAKVGKKKLTAKVVISGVVKGVADSEEVFGVLGELVLDDQTSKVVSMVGHLGKLPSTSKWIGAYTCLGPNGGRLALKVATSGTVKAAGTLGDGKKISLSTPLCSSGFITLYAPAGKQKIESRNVLFPKFCRDVKLVPSAGNPLETDAYGVAYRNAGVRAVVDGKGSVKYSTDFGQAAAGKTVKVTATASKGNVFAYWTDADGTIVSLTPGYSVKMDDADVPLTAVFRPTTAYDAKVPPQPILDEGSFENLVVGVAFSTQVTVDPSFYPVKFSASSLPKGLSINATTGVISGVPTEVCEKTIAVSAACTAVKKAASGKTELLVAVRSFPKAAVGAFTCNYIDFWDGPLALADDVQAKATTSLSITDKGKLTGKIKVGTKSYSFTAGSFRFVDADGGVALVASTTLKVGQKSYAVEIRLHGDDVLIVDLAYTYGGKEAGFAALLQSPQ